MADYGIKVTKAGFDTSTAAVKDQIFNSSYNNFKIIAEGSTSVVVPVAGGASGTVNHGLSYRPGYLAFAQMSGSATISYIQESADLFSGSGETFLVFSTATNIRFEFTSTGTGYTAQIYYYIFADRAE